MADIALDADVSCKALVTNASLIILAGIAASVTCSVSASATVTRTRAVQASAACATSSSASLRVGNAVLSAQVSAKTIATAALGVQKKLAAIGITAVGSEVRLSNVVALGSNQSKVIVSAVACLDAGRPGPGVCDAVREIMLLWGLDKPFSAPPYTQEKAINILNTSLQVVWNQAKDRTFWTRSTITLNFDVGESTQTLDDAIQNVVGHARLASKRQLVPCGSLGQIEFFGSAFLGQEELGLNNGTPMAYYVERMAQNGPDPAKCVLHIAPAPDVTTSVLLDVVNEAPHFKWTDATNCTLLPIPHKYVESLLLPVARYLAMSFYMFIGKDQVEQIKEGYAMAQELMDNADPLPAKDGDNTNRRKEELV